MTTRAQKEEHVGELREKFNRATSVYVADYRGLDVPSVNELRSRIHKEGGGDFEYHVEKNSLLKLAAEGSEAAGLDEHFQGPTAVAFSFGDPVGLARVLAEFSEGHEVFELKGGLLDGRTIDSREIGELAKLPPLDSLRGMIVGLLQAPATQLVRLVSEPGAGLARLVEARRSKLESEGAG